MIAWGGGSGGGGVGGRRGAARANKSKNIHFGYSMIKNGPSIAAGGSASYVYLCLSVLQFMYTIGDFFRFMFGSWRELANIRLKNEMHERAVG